MFPPSSLLATPCPPKTFNFYTCSNESLLEFSVPIDFVVTRTALINGLASWFDLDFFPNPKSDPPIPSNDDEALLEQWDYPVNKPFNMWSVGSQEVPLNPGPTPPPPPGGLHVRLSTGPDGELARLSCLSSKLNISRTDTLAVSF